MHLTRPQSRKAAARFILTLTLALIAHPSPAATTISWQPVQGISSDSDVSNAADSTSIFAYFFAPPGGAASTVNGVTFQPFSVPNDTHGNFTVGDVSIFSEWNFTSQNVDATTGSFAALSSEYQGILNSTVESSTPPVSLVIDNLTPNQTYLFQYWLNVSNFGGFFYNTNITMGGSTASLQANPTAENGGLGQYVIGTFTPGTDQTSVTLLLTPQSQYLTTLTAIQLRAVPEPGAWALAALGLGVLALIRRSPALAKKAARTAESTLLSII